MPPTPKKKVARKIPRKAVKKKPAKKTSSKAEDGYLGRSPLAVTIYGPSGVGKTSFAAHFPKPLFIIDPQEDGITDLAEYKQVKEPVGVEVAESWEQLLNKIDSAALNPEVNSIVLDSLTGFEKLCFQYHCREYFENDWSSKGFYSFSSGPKNAAKTDWPNLLDKLDDARGNGKNVILIGHSSVKPFSNPEGADYDRFTPYMDKETWQQVHRWSKAILFYNYYVNLEKKTNTKAKATGDERRLIYTEWSPSFDAKNRYGLDNVLEAGSNGEEAYEAFESAMLKAGK